MCERVELTSLSLSLFRSLAGIDLKKASKIFAQKFATGSSVTKNPQGQEDITVQGDVTDEIVSLRPFGRFVLTSRDHRSPLFLLADSRIAFVLSRFQADILLEPSSKEAAVFGKAGTIPENAILKTEEKKKKEKPIEIAPQHIAK